jgi:uncharacterized protein involved in exopolysaccharide biosynthesis
MFKRFWWVFLAMLPVGPLVGCVLAFLVTRMIPKQYESQTVIEVKPRVMVGNSESAQAALRRPRAESMENHSALIKSPEILSLTAENLKLAERWNLGRNDTLSILTESVNVGRVQGTDLIFIRARHTDKVAARDISDGVAKAYKQHRNETQERRAESFLSEIREAVKKQEDIVEGIRNRLRAAKAKLSSEGKSEENESATQDYEQLKSEFVAAQDVLQEKKLKQMGETISRKIPWESVELHDPAVISNSPVAPNVRLNLVLGTAAGFLFSPLLALPVIWLLGRITPVRR